MTFISLTWHCILGLREFIFRELVTEFLSTFRYNRDTRIWSDDSNLSFKLGRVARSCSLIELGQCLEIYPAENVDHPLLEAYLDHCILSEPREYNHLSVWSLYIGDYIASSAKESNFRSPLY